MAEERRPHPVARREHEPWAYAACALVTVAGAWVFLRYPFQPMQDLGHHMAIAAITSDYASTTSIYPPLYEAPNPLQGNSLLYTLAGPLGRALGVTEAVRAILALAIASLTPLTAVALRRSGRSTWPALLAPALAHSLVFVAGFANLVVATPLVLLAVVAQEALLERPNARRTAALAAVLVALFLAHVHAFLWTGALLALRTIVVGLDGLGAWLAARHAEGRPAAWRQLLLCALAAAPSLAVFARWYGKTFGEGRAEGGVLTATGSLANGFGASFRTLAESMRDLPGFVFELTQDDADTRFFVALAIFVAACAFVAPRGRRRSQVLPAAFALTFGSYFFLPEGLQGHDIVASRQPALAMLFLPALVAVPPASVASLRRRAMVAGLLALVGYHFVTWARTLQDFHEQEAAGLEEVLRAAPPRLRLHYVKSDPSSRYFAWRPFWHVEKFYMSMKLGQTADTPAVLSTGALRARAGVDMHRIVDHSERWPMNAELWLAFDLVLLRRWMPSPELRAEVERHADLVAKRGDWELWRTRR
jgi:hypothetical protein